MHHHPRPRESRPLPVIDLGALTATITTSPAAAPAPPSSSSQVLSPLHPHQRSPQAPPVMGLVTASNVALPFDLDPNDPILLHDNAKKQLAAASAVDNAKTPTVPGTTNTATTIAAHATNDDLDSNDDDDSSVDPVPVRRSTPSKTLASSKDDDDDDDSMSISDSSSAQESGATGPITHEEEDLPQQEDEDDSSCDEPLLRRKRQRLEQPQTPPSTPPLVPPPRTVVVHTRPLETAMTTTASPPPQEDGADDEDLRELQAALLERIHQSILKAEEEDLLQRIHVDILHAEERCLLRRIEQDICKHEQEERRKKKQSTTATAATTTATRTKQVSRKSVLQRPRKTLLPPSFRQEPRARQAAASGEDTRKTGSQQSRQQDNSSNRGTTSTNNNNTQSSSSSSQENNSSSNGGRPPNGPQNDRTSPPSQAVSTKVRRESRLVAIATPSPDAPFQVDEQILRTNDTAIRVYEPTEEPDLPSTTRRTGSRSSRVQDLEQVQGRTRVTKRLPKWLGAAPRTVELTMELFQDQVVNPLLQVTYLPERSLQVRLVEIPRDPHSVYLEAHGHASMMERLVTSTSRFIQSYQTIRPSAATSEVLPSRRLLQASSSRTSSSRKAKSTAPRRRDKTAPQREDDMELDSEAALERSKAKRAATMKQYEHFAEKFKAVNEIEYKGYINLRTSLKFMWLKHKALFGPTCDENCLCPSTLNLLTEDVVSGYMRAEIKKDPDWINQARLHADDSPVGLVNRFAKKFYPMLKEEFPGENPKQLLERIVLMFRKHLRERTFGLKCLKHCPCSEGWELVFKKGHLRPDELQAAKKAKAADKSAIGRVPRRNSSEPSQLPAKRKSVEEASQPAASTLAIPKKKARRAPSDSSLLGAAPAIGAPSAPRSYEVVYSPGEPLGFFCKATFKDGGLVCLIESLSPHGREKDPRLQNGTAVKGVVIGGQRQPVNTHDELKKEFENAKERRLKLHVQFINTYVNEKTVSNISSMGRSGHQKRILGNKDWTSQGLWQGHTKGGWAGGAAWVGSSAKPQQKSGLERQIDQKNRIELTENFPPPEQPIQGASNNPAQEEKAGEQVEEQGPHWYTSSAVPGHRSLPKPRSVLRSTKFEEKAPQVGLLRSITGTKRSASKNSVHFTEGEVRLYAPSRGSREMATSNSPSGSDNPLRGKCSAIVSTPHDISKEVPSLKNLIEAIRSQSYREVIELLKRGAPADEKDEAGMRPRDHVKTMIEARHDTGPTGQDLVLKDKALKVFINIKSTIDSARFLKTWVQLEVTVVQVKNIQLTRSGRERQGTANVLGCHLYNNNLRLGDMPLVPIAETVDWKERIPPHHLNFNKNISIVQDRELVVTLEMGSPADAVAPVRLGRVAIPLAKLCDEGSFEDDIFHNERFDSTEFLVSGTVVVKVGKKRVPASVHEGKRGAGANDLKNSIEWIRRLNEQIAKVDVSAPQLSAHIAPAQCGHISLLHAAIYLSEEKQIKPLLDMGADPYALSQAGTALALAERRSDGRGEHDDQGRSCHEVLLELTKGMHCDSLPEQTLTVHSKSTAETLPASSTSDQARSSPTPEGETGGDASAHSLDVATDSSLPSPVENGTTKRAVAGDSVMHSDTGIVSQDPKLARDIHLNDNFQSSHGTSTVNTNGNRKLPSAETLPSRWAVPSTQKLCIFFNNSSGCKHGSRCRYAHTRTPLGDIVDKPLPGDSIPTLSEDVIEYRECGTANLAMVIAAAYRDVDGTTYFAEGGNSIYQNKYGVCFYLNHTDAKDALRRVLLIWRNKLNDSQDSYRYQAQEEKGNGHSTRFDEPSYHHANRHSTSDEVSYYGRASEHEPSTGASSHHANRHSSYMADEVSYYGRGSEHEPNTGASTYSSLTQAPQQMSSHHANRHSSYRSNELHYYGHASEHEPSSGASSYSTLAQAQQQTSSYSSAHKRVFSLLCKTNVNNIFASLFKTGLRKDWWTFRNLDDGLVSAELHLPEGVSLGGTFRSYDIGGGRIINNYGYYLTVEEARASVMYYVLLKAAKEGLVSSDLRTHADGTPFKFRK